MGRLTVFVEIVIFLIFLLRFRGYSIVAATFDKEKAILGESPQDSFTQRKYIGIDYVPVGYRFSF